MNTLEKNMQTLHNLYMEYPNSLQGLTAEGTYLVLGDKKVDISTFDITSLFNDTNHFSGSLEELSAEDIFRIIRVHALGTEVLANDDKKNPEKNDQQKLQEIKKENPLMKNVTIVNKPGEFGMKQYFNIVDSTGKDNLFYNDMNIDIFGIYEYLKIRKGGNDVTSEELIEAIRRKLYDVDLMNVTQSDNNEVKDDFKNKINYQDELYKGEKSIRVYGNQDHDITVVNDDRGIDEHQVLTYENNEHGDVVATIHSQNVNGEQVVLGNGTQVSEANTVGDDKDNQKDTMEVQDDEEKEKEFDLIPIEQFYYVLDTGMQMDEDLRHSMDLWYAFLEELVIYEDFLNPELKDVLNRFIKYIEYIQLHGAQLNENQIEASNNLVKFQNTKLEKEIGQDGKEKVESLSYVYTKKPLKNTDDNTGFISYVQIFGFILAVSAILTAIALYFIRS